MSNKTEETGGIMPAEQAELWETLLRIGEAAQSGTEELYEYIVEAVHRLTQCPVAMWRVDEKHRTQATIRAHRGLREEYARKRALELLPSVTGEVIRTYQPIEVEDIEEDLRVASQTKVEAREQGWKSMLVVPLLAGPTRAVGTLSIYRFVKTRFAPWEIDRLRTFASQAGMAVQNVDRLQTIRRLNEVGRSLTALQASPEILQQTLDRIANTALEVLRADLVDLYQYQADKDDFVLPPIMVGERRRPDLVPSVVLSDDVIARIAHTGEPIYASQAQEHPVLAGDWESPREGLSEERFVVREEIVSSAGVPVRVGEEVAGVVFASYRGRREFERDAELRETIEAFTNFAGVAIQNARLLQQEQILRQQAETLRKVSGAIRSDLELKEVAERILDGLHEVVEYGKASMQLIRGDVREMIAYRDFAEGAVDEWDRPTWLLPRIPDDPLIRRVLEDKEPLILSDVLKDPDWKVHPGTADVKSWVGLPLFFGERPVGLVTIDHDQPSAYTQGLKDLLVAFANQAAIAIENARLLDDARRRIRDLQIINRVGQVISTKLDTEDLLKTIVSEIADKLHCTHCTLFFPERQDGEILLVPQVTHGIRSEVLTRRFKLGEGLLGWVYQQGESLVLPDARTDPRFAPARDRQERPRSMLVVPIKVGDQTVGIISADQDEYGWFGESERSLVEALARQIGVAIQRAIGLDLLREIGDRISRADKVDDILQHIVQGAIELTNTTAGVIYLLSEDGRFVLQSFEHPSDFHHPPPRMKEGGITRRIFETGQREIIPDVREKPRPSVRGGIRVNPEIYDRVRSMIGEPLKLGEKVIGVLFLNDKEPHRFTETEVSLLSTLASQAAIAIENARLLDDARRRIRDLQIINTVGQVIGTKLDTKDLLKTIVSQIADKLHCTHCTLFFPQMVEGENLLVPQVTHGIRKEVMTRRFKLEEGLVGWVYQRGESLVLSDARADPRFAAARDRQERPRSMLVAPVKVGTRTIGVISADQDEFGWFNESDRWLADALAQQAGIAIERAVGLGLLQNIGNRIIGAQQVDEILQLVVSGALELTHTTSGVIYLISPDGKSVTRSFQYPLDFDHPKPRLDKGKGITRQVLKTGETMFFSEIKRDARVNRVLRERGIRSMIAVPLKLGQEVTGVLYLNDTALHEFTETELSLLSTLANQAAIAIQSVRLFEASAQQAEELTLLQQVSAQLMTLDLDKLLSFIVEGAMRLTKTESGFIYLLNDDGTRISKSVAHPSDSPYPQSSPSEKGLTRYIFEHGESVFITDTSQDERVNPAIVDLGIKSFFGQPLKVADKVIGILYLNDRSFRSFSKSERSLIQTLADQAAVAIYNARLFEDSRRLSRGHQTLNSVGAKLIGMVDEKEILEYVARSAADTVDCTHCTIFRLQENEIVVATSQGNRGWSMQEGRTFELDRGVACWVAQKGETALVPDTLVDVRFEPGWSYPQPDPRSLVVVPMLIDEGVYGVISIEHDRVSAFDRYDQQLMETLASLANQAVQNARLFETRRRLEIQLQSLHQVVQEQNLDKVLERSVEGISDILGEGTSPTINLYSEQTGKFTRCHACGPLREELQVPPRKAGTGRYVIETGEPLYLPDVLNPPSGCPTVRPASIAMGIKSFAAIPLKRQEHIVGVLFVNAQKPLSFSPETRRILELFAGQAAIAIHISQDLERKIRELDALTKIGHAVANLGVDEILDLIYNQAEQIMDLTDAQVQIAFYDRTKDEVTFPLAVEQDKESGGIIDRVRWGRRERQFRKLGERAKVKQFVPRTRREPPGLTEYVIRKQESVLITEDFEQEARKLGVQVWPVFGRLNRPTHSWLGVPMIVQGQVIGIISIQSLEKEMAFDQGHVRLLETVANQAAVAVENARLLEREKERARQLEGLQQIGLKITSSLDLQEVLYSIAENTNLILKSDFTTIFPYGEERGFGEGARAGKFSDKPSAPSQSGICAQIVQSGQAIQVEDAASYPGTDPDLLKAKKVKSFVGVPVKFGDRAVGVILANYMQKHIFTHHERNLAEQIAALAAVAIENATRAELIANRERYMTMVGLAADLVHRINNKAGTIPIRVQQLEAKLDPDDPKDSALRHIAQGIARDARDLLAESAELEHLGEAEAAPEPSLVSVHERLETIASKIQVECPESIEVITDIAADLPPICAVTEELDHVLWSVAHNGVEAMLLEGKKQGGMLIIRAQAVEREDQIWIEIRISDQGPGISTQMRDRLFEPFYSTRPGRFRGFGLWRARQVLRKLGGSIHLVESKGPGTTFVIELPAAADGQEVQNASH